MQSSEASLAGRIGCFVYGLIAYVCFLVALTYAAGFVSNLVVPKGIDSGETGPTSTAMLVNALLLGLFAVQHTIMARPAFKRWWTKIIPQPIERSTFVLVTSLVFFLMFWQWRPLPTVVWSVEAPVFRAILYACFASGFLLVLYSSFLIDHFDLFGLRQVTLHLRGKEYTHPEFAQPMLYRIVRNPLMLGFLIAFWFTPDMTQGHLLFSIMVTGYIFVGIQFEERDILKELGEDYARYRERTPMVFPFLKRRKSVAYESTSEPPVAL